MLDNEEIHHVIRSCISHHDIHPCINDNEEPSRRPPPLKILRHAFVDTTSRRKSKIIPAIMSCAACADTRGSASVSQLDDGCLSGACCYFRGSFVQAQQGVSSVPSPSEQVLPSEQPPSSVCDGSPHIQNKNSWATTYSKVPSLPLKVTLP